MIRVRAKGIEKVRSKLRGIARGWPRQAAVAVNKSQQQTRLAFIDAVRGPQGATTMKLAKARQLVKKGQKASAVRHKATIVVKGDPVGLHNFSARVSRTQGITVQVRRRGGKERYERAWKWNGQFWQRARWSKGLGTVTKKGNPIRRAKSGYVQRFPIVRLEGPRISSILARDKFVRTRAAEQGLKILKKEVRLRWRKLINQ